MRRLYERGAPELGIRNFEFWFILGFACVFELFNLELAVLTGIHIFLTRRHEHRFHPINSKWAIHNAPWRTIQKSPLGFAACLSKNSKFLIRTASAVRHANIVQRVKSCYKIKIDSRVPDCCFYGVLLCKQHPSLTIAPLLHYNSATIRV